MTIKTNTIFTFLLRNKVTFIVTIISICLILWNRLLRERLPRTLEDFNDDYKILLILFSICLLSITIIVTVKNIFSTQKAYNSRIYNYMIKKKVIKYIIGYLDKLQLFFTNRPKILFEVLYKAFNVSKIFERPLHKLSGLLRKRHFNPYIFRAFYILCNTLPKIIPAVTFFIEVVLYHEINHFYKVLFLLLIPLCYSIITSIVKQWADKSTYFATAHIKIVHGKKGEGFVAMFRQEIPNIEGAVDFISREYDEALLEWFVYIYKTYAAIKWLIYMLELEKQRIYPYEKLCISIIYLSGWFYLMYVILYNP